MSVVTLFNGSFCLSDQFVEMVQARINYTTITDVDIIAKAAGMSAISPRKIENILVNKPSIFNNITHEKERGVSWLKLAMAETLLESDNALIYGLTGHLVPDEITHVLRVCLIADQAFRVV